MKWSFDYLIYHDVIIGEKPDGKMWYNGVRVTYDEYLELSQYE